MSERWEYKVVSPSVKGMGMFGGHGEKFAEYVSGFLNDFGRIGWEAYHVKTDSYPPVFYLKRKI